jgi:hypothetical protein
MAALCTWLLPGSGHVAAGQKDKGILVGAAVVVVFAVGLALSAGHAVDRQLFGAWWVAQICCGGPMVFAALVTAPLQMTAIPAGIDYGLALCTVAGLMNVMVMTDAYTVAESKSAPAPSPASAGATP